MAAPTKTEELVAALKNAGTSLEALKGLSKEKQQDLIIKVFLHQDPQDNLDDGTIPQTNRLGIYMNIASSPAPAANQDWIPLAQKNWTGEGISLDDPVITNRKETCEKIASSAFLNKVVIVDSPPYSGKTSLITLLSNFLISSGCACEKATWIHELIEIDEDSDDDDEDRTVKYLKQHFIDEFKPRYKRLRTSDKDHKFFLVDEAQKSYILGTDHVFWQIIKKTLQGATGINFVLFSSWGSAPLPYGTGTPVAIQTRFHLQDIRMTEGESKEIIDNFNKSQRYVKIKEASKEVLLSTTSYHVGHVKHLLRKLKKLAKNDQIKFRDEAQIINAIQIDPTITFETCFEKTRMAKPSIFTKEQIGLLLEIFKYQIVPFTDGHLFFIKNGVLSYDFDKESNLPFVFFSSSWIKKCYLQAIYCKLPPVAFKYFDPVKPNIDQFIYEVISRMNKKRILDAAELREGTLTEYAWQSEFYRAACSCLTDHSCISPEVYTNGEHRLDFYINSNLKFAFELLRDGHGIREHISRFAPGGSYYGMITSEIVAHSRVIDFRMKENYQSTKLDVTYACFDQVKSQFKLVRGDQTIVIPLA